MNTPYSLTTTVGIGDLLQIEQYFTDGERASLTAIWHAFDGKTAAALRSLMESCPAYAHVAHKYLQYPTQKPPGSRRLLADQGVLHRKAFTGSSFVKHPLADLAHFDLPERFDFLHLATPFNTPGVRRNRDMTAGEWVAILKRLEDRDTHGVVINSCVEGELPDHPRLVDLRGKTTLPEAVELLKCAAGYTGIDSCFSVVAPQLFSHDDILIRTTNPDVVAGRWEYYPPHGVIGFLTREFGKSRYPTANRPLREPGTLVELRCNARVGATTYRAGSRVEMEANRAAMFIAAKKAVPHTLED